MTTTEKEQATPKKRAPSKRTTKPRPATSKPGVDKDNAAPGVPDLMANLKASVKAAKDGTLEEKQAAAPPAERVKITRAPKALEKGEFELELPSRPTVEGDTSTTVVRFFKPKTWKLVASGRNARHWHVLDDERPETVLCTIPVHTWVDVQEADKAKVPITCPWCRARMIACKGVTDAGQQKLIEQHTKAKEQAKAEAAKRKKEKEAAAKKKEADTKPAAAPEKPQAKPDPKPKPDKAKRGPRKAKAAATPEIVDVEKAA